MCQTCTRSPMSCSVHSSSMFSLLSEGWPVSRWLLMENCTFVEASQGALSGDHLSNVIWASQMDRRPKWNGSEMLMWCAVLVSSLLKESASAAFPVLSPYLSPEYILTIQWSIIFVIRSVHAYSVIGITDGRFGVVNIFGMLSKSLMFIKASFIWSKIQ